MRALLLTPLLLLASPVFAQVAPMPYPPEPYPPAPYAGPAPVTIPPELTDPAMAAQLGRMAGALTRAVMNLPVGELQAAIEGRPTTPADRRRTIGSETHRSGKSIDRDVEREVASSAGAVQNSARAIARALPALQQALGQAAAEIERATANLPDARYPRR
ncbi:MAG: hypothetical protein ABR588_02710 [Sphingomicrobium sp.]|nr:hypothetical protein [Sphingomonadales bacterium]